MQKPRDEIYSRLILLAIPRLLTELDRDPFSSTFGSFDREYWAWATKDFSNVDLQRGVYGLSLIYLNNFDGNFLYQNNKLLEWIKAGITFWIKDQSRVGSHDHHYPNEYSFVGAAFPLYELTETFFLLQNYFEDDFKKIFVTHLSLAGDFICRYEELHGFISNHRIGAACGLENLYRITNDVKFKIQADALIKSVVDKRSVKDGWVFEYSGADPGYQTLATYYMANYYRITGDQNFFNNVIRPSLNFIQYFVHPDGSVGGEYGSRNCSLYFPSGFELLSNVDEVANLIAETAIYGIQGGETPTLLSMDIRNFVPMLSSYVQAMIEARKLRNNKFRQSLETLPINKNFEKYWEDCGIYIRSTNSYYLILALSKGGVLKVFSKSEKKLIHSNCGYMVTFEDGTLASNQFYEEQFSSKKTIIDEDSYVPKRLIEISGSFFDVMKVRTQSKIKFLLFRIFNNTIGQNIYLANLIKRKIITRFFIHRRKKINLNIYRRFEISDDEIVIEDRIDGPLLDLVREIRTSEIFTNIYMASSKYFRKQELIENKNDLTGYDGRTNILGLHLRFTAEK
jgi:hypothetical protein